MLKYQNATGMTLRPSNSLLSSCTKKREANRPWPTNPTAIQICSGVNRLFILKLLYLGAAAVASLQPAHPQQILHADQQAAEVGVFRCPGQPRAMIHRHKMHLPALALHQRDQETVEVIEIGQVHK